MPSAEDDALDALARALCKADGKVYWTEAFPAAYRDQARALLADGWLPASMTHHTGSDEGRIVKALAQHPRGDWSDRTYSCAGCAQRYEKTADPFEMSEYSRLAHPDWTLADYHAHLAAEIAAALAERPTET